MNHRGRRTAGWKNFFTDAMKKAALLDRLLVGDELLREALSRRRTLLDRCVPGEELDPRRGEARVAVRGNDREPLERLCDAARAEDVPVIPLPGGFQPRAAVAYSTVVALEVAWLCGAGERLHDEGRHRLKALERIYSQVGRRTGRQHHSHRLPDGPGQGEDKGRHDAR